MKRVISISICFLLLLFLLDFLLPIDRSLAHPGRTDSNGGHWDHENGTYHYHSNSNSNNKSQNGSGGKGSSTVSSKADSPIRFDFVDILSIFLLGVFFSWISYTMLLFLIAYISQIHLFSKISTNEWMKFVKFLSLVFGFVFATILTIRFGNG